MPCNYKNYPPNWLTEIRPSILQRANNCCEKCNVANYEIIIRGEYAGVKVYQLDDGKIFNSENGDYMGSDYLGAINNASEKFTEIILTIAHLDNDPENLQVNDDRLKALCQRCHLLIDKDANLKKRRETLDKKKGMSNLF